MGRITILDPTSHAPEVNADPGPSISTVNRRVVGIRSDRTWRSFEWVADEWQRLFEADGARVRRWTAGNRIGEEGERTREQLDEFTRAVDLAIVGLGN
jgi:hypothetical protein